MEYNFSNEEMSLIKEGLKTINSDASAELLKKIEIEMGVKEELGSQMLHDFYGDEKEFEVVAVNEANEDKLEDYLAYYEDTNKFFYDKNEERYSILRSKDGYEDEVAINTADWEEWLAQHE